MINKILLSAILISFSLAVRGNFPSIENSYLGKSIYSDSIKNNEDSLTFLANTYSLDSAELKAFLSDFRSKQLAIFYEQKSTVAAWRVCIADDSLRTQNIVLQKTAKFLHRNQHKSEYLKNEFQNTSKGQRSIFLLRTWWSDSLKSNFDSLGNSSGFRTWGIDIKEIKKSLLDDMKAEASAPQFVESLINSGKNVPKKIIPNVGYALYKIIPKGNPPPSPFTPFWTKIEDLQTVVSNDLEDKFGLPIVSHSAKYDVYKIQLKEGKKAILFESEIAPTTENGYKTNGGSTQTLVLDRAKWTFPVLINELEIFPPFKK
ncbi:MAG: hypothetical protein CFE22_03080 [Cytophagaceae bacterium BCCC1]|nr:MAG: hypothetical protein CFE22_03080 [Cytophagaceae bacterium BCCC1]